MIADASQCRSHVQTRTHSSLIHSRKGIWKGKLTRAKAFGKEAFIFFSSPDAPRTQGSDY